MRGTADRSGADASGLAATVKDRNCVFWTQLEISGLLDAWIRTDKAVWSHFKFPSTELMTKIANFGSTLSPLQYSFILTSVFLFLKCFLLNCFCSKAQTQAVQHVRRLACICISLWGLALTCLYTHRSAVAITFECGHRLRFSVTIPKWHTHFQSRAWHTGSQIA